MKYDESLLDRYKAIVAHAERGEGNEKANAQRLRAKMEAQYPGIKEQAFPPPPRDEGGFDPFRAWRSRGAPKPEPEEEDEAPRRGANRPRWADFASEAFRWTSQVVEEMSSLGTARAYAESITELQAKMLQSGKYQIALKFPLRDLYAVAGSMNEAQRQEFARYVAAMVEAQVLAILEEGA
jgi:hypothetical protein